MSEISFSSIYDGVSLALHAAFPAVQVHGGNVKQGLNPERARQWATWTDEEGPPWPTT